MPSLSSDILDAFTMLYTFWRTYMRRPGLVFFHDLKSHASIAIWCYFSYPAEIITADNSLHSPETTDK